LAYTLTNRESVVRNFEDYKNEQIELRNVTFMIVYVAATTLALIFLSLYAYFLWKGYPLPP